MAEQVEYRVGGLVVLEYCKPPGHPVECPVIDENGRERGEPHAELHDARVAHRVRDLVYAAPDPEAAEGESRYECGEHQLERVERGSEHEREHPDPGDFVYERGQSRDESAGEKQPDEIRPERLGSVPRLRNERRRFAAAGDSEHRSGERQVQRAR